MAKITGRTQRRIWSQVNHWLDWCVYEGELEANPFQSVRFEQKVKHNPYAVPTDDEVRKLIAKRDREIGHVLLFCVLSGMRAGEAAGLMRDDLVSKGNLGQFFHVRPNELRLLKTDAAERMVPVHSALEPVLSALPSSGPLFPGLKVNDITKRFATIRKALKLERPGLVSTLPESGSSPSASVPVSLSISQHHWLGTSQPDQRMGSPTASTRLVSVTNRCGTSSTRSGCRWAYLHERDT